MMSKASYMIQDSVRRMYGLVTDLHNPSTFFVRGRVPFPQGVAAVAQLFANKRPADVYAHKYFIEKQSDPSQPSPQLHLTEELHGIMKVMAGLRYMRDDTTKLDSTMMFVSDFDVDAKALMLASPDEDQNAYKMKKEDEQQQRAPAEEEEEEDPVGMKMKTGIELPPLPGINRELLKAANPIDPAELRKRPQRQPPPGTPIPASIQRRGGSAKYSSSSTSNTTSGGTSKRSSRRGDAYQPSKFPSPEQSSSGREANNRFFALFYPNHLNAADAEAEVPDPSHFTPPMREVCGGYTVLYNPIEVNEVAFEEVLRKLHNEKRAVMAIVVPSRHSYRHVQVWADAFPEARIFSSGPIPIAGGASQKGADSSSSSSSSQTSSAGYQVMTDGSMGLEFPEVDEAELAAAAPQQQQPSSHHEGDGGEDADPAEVLWKHREAVALPPQSFVGLRREDAHRLQLLSSLTQREGSGADVLERVELTPRIELLRVAGDAAADEYVLYDAQAAALACTDVYHGEYSDLDPVNSWMCRVWFKFMKRGNHKRTDIAPLYKIKQANVGELQSSIDAITRQRYIRYVVSAHGTPPLVEDAANCLRRQWGIPPLRGMERWSRRDVRR